jgi:hypothetical protein
MSMTWAFYIPVIFVTYYGNVLCSPRIKFNFFYARLNLQLAASH